MTEILIFPYNGNAIEAIGCLNISQKLIGFVDDDPSKQGHGEFGYKVYSRDAFAKFPKAKVLAVPGSPQSYLQRKKIIQELALDPSRFVNVIHPSAIVSPYASLGINMLIMANVVITANSRFGNHICVLPNTVIHHDVNIGDYSLIGSNVTIAGYTSINDNCYIGSGSSIINNVTIGEKTMVGMASNVINDVKAESKVAGNPSRYL